MSCPWFYSKSGSDYVAVGSTVTGNNKLFWVISLKNLDSSGGTLARTYTQSRRAELTVKRLRLNRNWLLTGLFSSNPAVQIQLSVSLKKFGVPKLIILSSKFEIITKSWVKLSLHWPFWANPFKIFIFNVPKQQKCTFEGHDLVMPWGVRGFQAFISSPLMIFWSKKLIWW